MYTTKDTGLIWFAFRIIHRITGTTFKLYLNKLKISDDKHRSICLHEPESITHLFFHCHLLQEFCHVCPFGFYKTQGKEFNLIKKNRFFLSTV